MKTSLKFNNRGVSIIVTLLIAVLIGYFIITLIGLRSDIRAQERENESLSQQISQQQAENRELEEILSSEDKAAYIERVAREHGYAGSDERVYYASDVS